MKCNSCTRFFPVWSRYLCCLLLLLYSGALAQQFPPIMLDSTFPQATFTLDTPEGNGKQVKVGTITQESYRLLYEGGYLPTVYGATRPSRAFVVVDASTGTLIDDPMLVSQAIQCYNLYIYFKALSSGSTYTDSLRTIHTNISNSELATGAANLIQHLANFLAQAEGALLVTVLSGGSSSFDKVAFFGAQALDYAQGIIEMQVADRIIRAYSSGQITWLLREDFHYNIRLGLDGTDRAIRRLESYEAWSSPSYSDMMKLQKDHLLFGKLINFFSYRARLYGEGWETLKNVCDEVLGYFVSGMTSGALDYVGDEIKRLKLLDNINLGAAGASAPQIVAEVSKLETAELEVKSYCFTSEIVNRLVEIDGNTAMPELAAWLEADSSYVNSTNTALESRLVQYAEFATRLATTIETPERPGSIQALPQTNGTVRLTWAASATNRRNGGRPEHYRLQYWDEDFQRRYPNGIANLSSAGWPAPSASGNHSGYIPATVDPGQTETFTFSPDRRKIAAGKICYLALAAFDGDVEDTANRSPVAFASVIVPEDPDGISLSASVDPAMSQTGMETYTYTLAYQQKDGLAADANWPKLLVDGAEVGAGAIQLIDQQPNYKRGVTYEARIRRNFALGQHTFTWQVQAGGTPDEVTMQGPKIGSRLGNSGLVNHGGNRFTFYTTWMEKSGAIPDSAQVYRRYGNTGADWADMRFVGGDPKGGARYEWGPATIAHRDYVGYYFLFRVGWRTYRDPESGYYTNLVTQEIKDLAVRNLRIEPANLIGGQTATILVDVFNYGTTPVENVTVRAKIGGVALGDPVVIDDLGWAGTASNYQENIAFSWPMPLMDEEKEYTVSVEVGALSGETNTANNRLDQGVTVVPPPGSISGYVFESMTLKGKENVAVCVQSGPSKASAVTDENGFYWITGLRPGTYSLEAKEGGSASTMPNIAVHAGVETSGSNIIFGGATLLWKAEKQGWVKNISWSPDGTKLVFQVDMYVDQAGVSYDDSLFKCNADGSNLTRLTGPDNTSPAKYLDRGRRPEWSPDGSKIICWGLRMVQGQDTIEGVFTIPSSGDGSSATLVKARRDAPSYHPNNGKIAWIFGENTPDAGKVYVFNPANGADTRLTDLTCNNLDWSPDGTMIAADGKILDAQNGQLLYSFNYNDLCWLPDSSGVLAANGESTIWLLLLNDVEHPVQIAPGPVDHHPQLSPDGSKLAFSSRRGISTYKIHGLFVQDFHKPSTYISGFAVSSETFSPNGDGVDDSLGISFTLNQYAYVTARILDSNGNLVRVLLDDQFTTGSSHTISWDGLDDNGLLARCEVYFCQVNAHNGPSDVAFPVWKRISLIEKQEQLAGTSVSPNGFLLAGASNDKLWVWNFDGASPRLVWDPPEGWAARAQHQADWAPDNRTLVFEMQPPTGRGPQLATIDIESTPSFHQITFDEGSGNVAAGEAWMPRWSPDGSMISLKWTRRYAVDTWGNNIYVLDADGSAPLSPPYPEGGKMTSVEGVGSTDVDEYPTWTPDGEWILFTRVFPSSSSADRSAIYKVHRYGGQPIQLTSNPFTDTTPDVSPDGTQFLYASDRQEGLIGGLDLWIEYFDGSQRYCLTKNGFGGRVLRDGKRIMMSGGLLIEIFQSISLGQIQGQVVVAADGDDAPVPGAVIRALQDRLVKSETFSGASGYYQFFNLPPGTYSLEASKTGYESVNVVDGLVVQANKVAKAANLLLARLPDSVLSIDRATTHTRNEIVLHAEPIGGTVAEVAFEYQSTTDTTWLQIGKATSAPFHMAWDMSSIVVAGEERAIQVRAIAGDGAGKMDDVPSTMSLVLDGRAPRAVVSVAAGGAGAGKRSARRALASPLELPFGELIPLSAMSGDGDLELVQYEIRRQGDDVWRGVGAAQAGGGVLEGVLDTGELVIGETYELRAVASDTAGNSDTEPDTLLIAITPHVVPPGPPQMWVTY